MNLNDFIDIIQNNSIYSNYNIVAIIDAILFLLFTIVVIYLFIFALASNKKRLPDYPEADVLHRFVFLFPAHKADDIIIKSVESLLDLQYPKSHYDIIVVAHGMQEETLQQLRSLLVQVIKCKNPKETKTSLIQYGINQMINKDYDMIVLLDSNNTVSHDFLTKINNAYYSGCQVVQTHRRSKDIQTDIQRLAALSEEINNSIFRKGHVRLGFSSALISSGMAFEYEWFKQHINLLDRYSFDKSLESMLLKEYIYIEYLEDAFIYDRKVKDSSGFYHQQQEWATNVAPHNTVYHIIKSLINENWDYADKLFQWAIPSRLILIGLLFLLSVVIFIIDWVMAIKWFILCFVIFATMSICIPNKMMTSQYQRAIILAPLLFILSILGRFNLKK